MQRILKPLATAFNRTKIFLDNPYTHLGLSWGNLKKLKHLPVDMEVKKSRFLGADVYFYNKLEIIHALDEIFIDEIYKLKLRDNAVIIDCGANIGLSVIYLKKCHPASQIIAFEPDVQNFTLLEKNITSFNLSGVVAKKEAVWIENTFINFSNEGNMSSKISTDPETRAAQPVKATRLRDYIYREIDFLKMDIEGAEYQVIKDLKDVLHFVKNLFVEYHGSFSQNSQLTELLKIFTDSNFVFYIKEAHPSYVTPFNRNEKDVTYDLQLNIFCFRQ